MYGDIRMTIRAKARRRPWISSTVHRASARSPSSRRSPSTRRSSPMPRDALTRTTSPSRSRGRTASRARSASRDAEDPGRRRGPPPGRPRRSRRRPRRRRPASRPCRAAASPTTRWPSSLRVAELEHLAEDRDPPTRQAGQQVERGDHGAGRRVVGVVDERHAPETDELDPMRRGPAAGEARHDLLERQARRRDRPRPPPARCGPRAARASGSSPAGACPRRGA